MRAVESEVGEETLLRREAIQNWMVICKREMLKTS